MKKFILFLSLFLPLIVFGSSAVGPGNGNSFGYQATPWVATPGVTFDNMGSVTSQLKCRQKGQDFECEGNVKAGTVVSSVFAINLPTGYVIDATAISTATNANKVGYMGSHSGAGSLDVYAAASRSKVLFFDGTTTNKIYSAAKTENTGDGYYTKANGDDNYSNRNFWIEFKVPIVGFNASGSSLSSTFSQVTVTGCDQGMGSTNTKIQRCSTTKKSIGTGITYTSSATLGGYFTVVTAADCTVEMLFGDSNSTTTFGLLEDPTGSTFSAGGAELTGNIRTQSWDDGRRAAAQAMATGSYFMAVYRGWFATGAKVYGAVNSAAVGFANGTMNMVCR